MSLCGLEFVEWPDSFETDAFSLTVSLCDADSGEDEGAYAGGDKTGTEGESEYDGRW